MGWHQLELDRHVERVRLPARVLEVDVDLTPEQNPVRPIGHLYFGQR